MLASWRGRKACKKRELLSLIGILMHAGKAIRAGRSFTRRLIDLAKSVKYIDQYVRLSREAQADIEWWHQYAVSVEWHRYDGVSSDHVQTSDPHI